MWFINAFIFIIIFVSSSNTTFTHPFWVILSGVTTTSLLLTDLNPDKAAALEDLVSLLTLSKADISTVNWYFDTSFELISSKTSSWYSLVYHPFSLSYLMILLVWLNRFNFFRIVVPSGYILLYSLTGTILTLTLGRRHWFVGVVFFTLATDQFTLGTSWCTLGTDRFVINCLLVLLLLLLLLVTLLVLGMLNIIWSYLISSFVGSPFWRNGVGGCGFWSMVIKSSTTATNRLADVLSGICVWRGMKCTVLDFFVSQGNGT